MAFFSKPVTFELTVIPAYGRTYQSKAKAWQDWQDGKDFQVADIGQGGRYINREDADRAGLACLFVRYGKRLEKSCSFNLIRNRLN